MTDRADSCSATVSLTSPLIEPATFGVPNDPVAVTSVADDPLGQKL